MVDELLAEDVSIISGQISLIPLEVTAKIRYNSSEAGAVVNFLSNSSSRISFKKPQRAVTPGQSVVFYKGDEVIGGGIISR
jgi:tRNA-specific 2-thiouridylase